MYSEHIERAIKNGTAVDVWLTVAVQRHGIPIEYKSCVVMLGNWPPTSSDKLYIENTIGWPVVWAVQVVRDREDEHR